MQADVCSSAIPADSGAVEPDELAPRGQSRLAYRLASTVLFLNTCLVVTGAVVGGGTTLAMTILDVGIDLVPAIGLLRMYRWARLWALVRAGVGAVGLPVLSFLTNDPFTAMVMSAMQWGLSGALVLLLTGKSNTWRLGLALTSFGGFTLAPFGLRLLAVVLVSLLARL